MTTRFHIVKFIESLTSGKGRNVAILAFDGWCGQYRTIGVKGNEIEPVYFQSIARKTPDSEWVFREWAHWLKSLALIRDIEQFDDALDRLKSNKSGFVVSGSGHTDLIKEHGHIVETFNVRIRSSDEADNVDVTMDRLFREYVKVPRVSPVVLFENRLASIFASTEIAYVKGYTFFDEPAVVEMESGNSNEVVTLEFSHLYSGANPVGFDTLILQGVKEETLFLKAERIAENFKNAIRTGYLQPDRCIVLCGHAKEKHRELLDQFSGVARVLDIFDESTPQKIRNFYNL